MKNWKTNLYTIWTAQIISLMGFGLGIPFIPYYIQELGITDPDKLTVFTGILSSAPALAMGIMAPVWGYFADKLGKKLMLLRAIFCGFIIVTLMGMVTNVSQLIVLRVLQGVFTGTIGAAATLVAATTPGERLAYALGVISSSTFIGNTAGPALGGFIAEKVGYRVSFYIGGALLFLDLLMVLFLVTDNKVRSINSDARSGYEKESGVGEKNINSGTKWIFVFSPTIIIILVILFCMRVSRTVFAPYLPLYVQELRSKIEGSSQITGLINSLIALMTAISGLVLSRLGDRYNKLNLARILLIAGIVFSLPLTFTNTLVQLAVLMAIMSFAVGGVEPVVMSISSELIPSDKRGVLFGFQTLVECIGWAVAPVLAGYMTINFSLKSIMILIPLFFGLSLLSTFVLSLLKKGKSNNCQTITEE